MSEAAIEGVHSSLAATPRPDVVREVELLLHTARVRLNVVTADRLESMIEPAVDWSRLADAPCCLGPLNGPVAATV
jgi:hypothetical protein